MTKSKHTPGPWVIRETDEYPDKLSIQTDEYFVALVDFSHTQAANARLIAAAPDLLEALEDAEALISGDLVGSDWKRGCRAFLKKARSAIAKAKGEE